jgi:hypothetical protein
VDSLSLQLNNLRGDLIRSETVLNEVHQRLSSDRFDYVLPRQGKGIDFGDGDTAAGAARSEQLGAIIFTE